MAQYGTIYRLSWNTVPSVLRAGVTIPAQAMVVNIYNTLDLIEDSEIPNVIELQADANPLIIKVINNDEDKFSPIRAKQAIIQFKSSLNQFQDATTFADSADNQWYVEITADGDPVFYGFLMLTDSQQDHLPDPNTVTLTASDHLGLLRDVPFVDDNGDNPQGYQRIIYYIANALKKTGLRLPIRVVNNLKHGSGLIELAATFTASNDRITLSPGTSSYFYVGQLINISGTTSNNVSTVVTEVTETYVTVTEGSIVNELATATFEDDSSTDHWYHKIYLDARTFEESIGVSEDCYTVLEKILGEDCFLTQWKGQWWIMRIDEYSDNPIYPFEYDADGVYIGPGFEEDFSKSIGANETRRLANADNLRRYDRPHKLVKEYWRITYPDELICNIDYERGDETADPDVQRSGYTAYELDGWTTHRLWGSLEEPPNFKASIQRSFNLLGDEETRFIMLTMPASFTGSFEYIRSCDVPMSYLDQFRFEFEVAAMQDTSGDGQIYVAYVVLYGVDGSVWTLQAADYATAWDTTLGEIDTQWKLSNENLTLFRDGLEWSIFDDADHPAKTEWQQCIMKGAPLPVDGNVVFMLFAPNQFSGTFDSFDIKYQNITLDYRPYIGGTYKKYTQNHHKVTRLSEGSADFNARREREVFLRDSPKPLFKGAMFFYNGIRYALTRKWWASNSFNLGNPPDQTYMHPYGYIQAFAVWNQYRTANRIFSSSVLGLGSMWVEGLDKISLTDTNPNTNNRYFLLISFEQNWKTALWSGVFIEDYRTDVPRRYDDDHEFKYTTE